MPFRIVIILALFIPFSSTAQLCNGSFGDPVVSITFGSSAGNSGFNAPPGYTYTSSSCPDDGFYTITTSTTSCFGGNWHPVVNDHTGNGGAFMLVNASFQPADFFLSTVSGLCPNTTYEFSAWILNVLIPAAGIEPNLTFTIETTTGTILNTFNTGNIQVSPQPAWQPFGFNFTTSSNQNSVVLRIRNNAAGGVGNDLALDDIAFRPCGPQLTSSILNHTDTVNVCAYDQSNYIFNAAASPGFVSPVYQWQLSTDSGSVWTDIPGATTLTLTRQSSSAGNYWYRLTSAESTNAGVPGCRINSNRLTINVYPRPAISAGPDKVVLAGKTTSLAASAAAGLSYNWSPPDNLSSVSILNPIASPQQDTWYTIDAVSPQGCVNNDQVLVKIVKGIYIPSAFTPNNDGMNDNWHIPFLDPAWGTLVMVFNRFGQMVYSTPGMVNWDGKLNGEAQPTGTYVYLLRFTDGSTPMKGLLHLIR